MKNLKVGTVVRFTEKWSRPSERKDLYVILETIEDREQAYIQCLTTDMYIKPINLVTYEMIEEYKG